MTSRFTILLAFTRNIAATTIEKETCWRCRVMKVDAIKALSKCGFPVREYKTDTGTEKMTRHIRLSPQDGKGEKDSRENKK